MTRRILSRIGKLEARRLPLDHEYKSWEVAIWNGTDKPDPFMTLYWAPGRPGRTVYHKRLGSPGKESQ